MSGSPKTQLLNRIWSSPTLNTWASLFGRTLGSIFLLPFAIKKLAVEEFNLWALFSSLIGLQLLIDMGFCVTFVRAIAFCLAGAKSVEAMQQNAPVDSDAGPNWELLSHLIGVMRYTYRRLALIYLVLLSVGGTLILRRPIALCSNPTEAWAAWFIVAASAYVSLRTNYLSVLLTGLNEVALVRRWDAITSLCSVATGLMVLATGGKLLGLIAGFQAWSIVVAFRNRWACGQVAQRRFRTMPKPTLNREIFKTIWPATWRSGVGVMMSFGLIQATGLAYAQFATAASSASYMLCLRMIQLISSFSQAPFYTKLAILPRLKARGRITELLEVAGNGMRKSLWTYTLAFAGASLIGPICLAALRSDIQFPPQKYWVPLGIMTFVERYAAMHLHLYSTTNRIITHVANSVTGALAIVFTIAFAPALGNLAFPIGLLAGYLCFYAWYPVLHSYREFKMSFWDFECRNSLKPLLALIAAVSAAALLRRN